MTGLAEDCMLSTPGTVDSCRSALLGELEVLDDDEGGRRGHRSEAAGAPGRDVGAACGSSGARRPARRRVVGGGPAVGGPQRPAGAGLEASPGARVDEPRGHARRRLRARASAGSGRRAPLRAARRARDGRRRSTATSASAIELLAEADSLWRGDALAEFAYEEFASAEVSRLSELRLAARSRSDSTSSCSSGDIGV